MKLPGLARNIETSTPEPEVQTLYSIARMSPSPCSNTGCRPEASAYHVPPGCARSPAAHTLWSCPAAPTRAAHPRCTRTASAAPVLSPPSVAASVPSAMVPGRPRAPSSALPGNLSRDKWNRTITASGLLQRLQLEIQVLVLCGHTRAAGLHCFTLGRLGTARRRATVPQGHRPPSDSVAAESHGQRCASNL